MVIEVFPDQKGIEAIPESQDPLAKRAILVKMDYVEWMAWMVKRARKAILAT